MASGLARVGLRSGTIEDTVLCQAQRGVWFWVCFAAQRGASPLVTGACMNLVW